jgi:hypothetical protein
MKHAKEVKARNGTLERGKLGRESLERDFRKRWNAKS